MSIARSAFRAMRRFSYDVDNDYRSPHYGGWQLIFTTPMFALCLTSDFYYAPDHSFCYSAWLMVLPKSFRFDMKQGQILWRHEIFKNVWSRTYA